MSPLGETIAAIVKKQLDTHGQVCILRRRHETFDENAGEWSEDAAPDDYPCRFIPEEFSEFVQMQSQFQSGTSKIYIAADDVAVEPREGTPSMRADLVYFGDWPNEDAAAVATATSHGRIERVGKEMRYINKQIAWGPIKVLAGAA